MRQPRGTIWTERALMVLFLASLAGALNLVMAVHRRAAATRKVEETVSFPLVQLDRGITNAPANDPRPPSVSTTTIVPVPSPPKSPSQVPEDPTKKALAELAAATAQEIDAARQADRRTESLEKARLNAIAESERWRRREMLVKQQVVALADRAKKIDQQIDALAAERDALAQERDALKAAVASNQQGKGSYAVLPYKGPNGSWRRPIVLECSNGTVTLRPKGPTFSMLDLSSLINPRSSPVILAIARELLRVQMSESPDGSPVVPYFVFLIRPDGIRPYYEIRARLEPLGIAFGYELIDQNLKVDVPDFDNLATWDGTIPLEEPLMPAPAGRNNGVDDGLAWPSAGTGSKEHLGATGNELAGRPGNKPGAGVTSSEGRSPDDFVWPSQGGTRASNRAGPSQSSGTSFRGSHGLLQGTGGSLDVSQGSGGSPGLAQGPGGSPGLAQGPRPGSFADGPRARDGQSGSGSESGSDPALKPWPFPNQGVELGSADARDAEGAPGNRTEAGSPPGRLGSGAGPAEARRELANALMPDLEPAGDGPIVFDPGDLARGLAAAASRAPGQYGLPMLTGPEGSGAGARSGQAATTSTGTGTRKDLAGSSDANSLQSPATSDLPPAGPPTNPQAPGLAPNTNTNTKPSNIARDGSAAPASRPGRAGDPQAGAGLNSTFGSQRSTSSASSTNATTGATGSSLASMNASADDVGSSLASMAGSASSTTSNASGLVFGSDAGSNSSHAKGSPNSPSFKSRIPDGPSKTIEVPFEIVVVCRQDGVVIHPGGYLLTSKSLETGKKDNIVVRELLAVAQRRAESDPTIRPQPRVKFLLENGGSESFWATRKQILFSGLGWPMSLQVAGAQDPHVLGKETW